MLRRIHDPERGASLLEYGAVIVLCLAILGALLGSGLLSTVSTGIQSATESLFTPEGSAADGEENGAGGGSTTGSGPGTESGDGAGDSGGSSGNGSGSGSGDDANDSGPGADGGADDDEPGAPSGSDGDPGAGGGAPQASPANDDDGGLLDDLRDMGGRALDGAREAGQNAVEDARQTVEDTRQTINDFRDDPIQAAQERYRDTREDLENIREAVEEDPAGAAIDLVASDEAQERCDQGDRAGCAGMVLVENGTAFIPGLGWDRKRQRAQELADRDGRRDQDSDNVETSTQAEGLPSPGTGSNRDNDDNRNDRDCKRSSFVPGTPVLSADGSAVPIEDISVGDEVWAFDPATGEEGPREVTHLLDSGGEKTLVDITVADTAGEADSLTATDEHPFWAPEFGEWVDAIDLDPGTWLRTSAGTWVQVTAAETRTVPDQQVHNLTVDDLHTYYVGDGTGAVLVHNSNQSGCDDGDPDRNYERPRGSDAGAREHADRALELQQGRDRNSGTVAVVTVHNKRTGEMETWVATEARGSGPPRDLQLRDDETYITGRGHAEQTIINRTRNDPDYEIVEGGTNRNICQPGESATGNCMPALDEEGLDHGGDYREGTRYKSGERHFWWEGD